MSSNRGNSNRQEFLDEDNIVIKLSNGDAAQVIHALREHTRRIKEKAIEEEAKSMKNSLIS